MEDELYHHGIKGQKWGVRRYQNADGSLTDAGLKRYNSELISLPEKRRASYTADPNKWVTDDLKRKRDIINQSNQIVRNLSEANNKLNKPKPKATKRVDLSSMSDEELRAVVNRKNLERQYLAATAEKQTVSKGKETVSKILDTAGTALTVSSSVVGLALSNKGSSFLVWPYQILQPQNIMVNLEALS